MLQTRSTSWQHACKHPSLDRTSKTSSHRHVADEPFSIIVVQWHIRKVYAVGQLGIVAQHTVQRLIGVFWHIQDCTCVLFLGAQTAFTEHLRPNRLSANSPLIKLQKFFLLYSVKDIFGSSGLLSSLCGICFTTLAGLPTHTV